MTPLSAVLRGLAAGAAGTAAMGAVQALEARASNGGSGAAEHHDSAPADWSAAPAPAQIGQRVAEGVFQREVPIEYANTVNQGVHWAYGTLWGAGYGLVHSSVRGGSLVHGLLFGTGVFAAAYAVLPAARIYRPLWEYSPKALAKDLARHLVYGAGVAGAYRVLERR